MDPSWPEQHADAFARNLAAHDRTWKRLLAMAAGAVLVGVLLGWAIFGGRTDVVVAAPEGNAFVEWKIRCTPDGAVEWMEHNPHNKGN